MIIKSLEEFPEGYKSGLVIEAIYRKIFGQGYITDHPFRINRLSLEYT